MPYSNDSASELVLANLPLLKSLVNEYGFLDLACGSGRNGLFLLDNGIPVIFADCNQESLDQARNKLAEKPTGKMVKAEFWTVDLELGNTNPLAGRLFDGVLVFNYLHRPLFPCIAQCIKPGGIVVYQTFTIDQQQFGRPKNPDYLLMKNELLGHFEGWETLYYFEGIQAKPQRAIASLIARKLG
jgi:tellurite methyltransferase